MDVVTGKSGSFFVVRKSAVDEEIIKNLADISFEEFGKYNAYATIKKISKQSSHAYAAQHGLSQSILDDFSTYEQAVDYRITQDLTYFLESEEERGQSNDYMVINPANYKNGFALAAPREVAGVITDSFQISDAEMPAGMKKVGISLVRRQLTHFVKWNDITYRVDVVPSAKLDYDSAFDKDSLTIVEYCYIFDSEDWRQIKKIEYKFEREVKQRKKYIFMKDKPEAEILDNIVRKMFKDKTNIVKYTRIFETYREIKNIRHDYRGLLIHKINCLKNKIVLENRRLKPNAKSLSARDMYYALVENERSSVLAATIDRVNTYWLTNNFEELLTREPCLRVLADKEVAHRDRLLKNLEFVVNVCLQWWTNKQLDAYQKEFEAGLPAIEAENSYAKGADINNEEYGKQLGIMYSLHVYNPDKNKHEFMRLDKYIKIPIPISREAQENIIDKAQYYIDRKKSSISFLMAKYGLSREIFWKAAKIYDAYRRIKRVVGKNS